MKKILKPIVIILCIILVMSMIGCSSQENENPDNNFPGNKTQTPDKTQASQQETQGNEQEIPSSFQDDSDENVTFDASVELPEKVKEGKLSYGDADFMRLDPDAVASALSNYLADENYQTDEAEYPNNLTLYHYSYTPKNPEDSIGLYDSGARLTFSSPYSNAMSHIFHNDTDDKNYYNADKFGDEDLPFASKEEVLKELTDMVKGLGIEVLDEYEIYSLSKEKLDEEQERLRSIDSTLFNNNEVAAIDGWEDCYRITLRPSFEGIKMLDETFSFKSYDGAITPARVDAIVTKDGLKMLEVESYAFVDGTLVTEPIISLEDAANSLKQAYSMVILDAPIEIDNISMCYIVWDTKLKPAYQFHGSQDGVSMTYYIDAVTGEQII